MNENHSEVGSRLLLVDDSADVLESLEMVLDDMGYQVDTAMSGNEALSQVRAKPYGLVLCDVGMPGMSGWEVADQIRSVAPATKVFLLTGLADQIPDGDPRLRSVDGILPKPIELDRLERFLDEQLKSVHAA